MMRFTALTATFQGEVVLDGLEGHLEPGALTVLVGPSGVGKTTLLRTLAGLVPHEGSVEGPSAVMVFQTLDQLFPWMTLFQNVQYAQKLRGIGNNDEIAALLEAVGLGGEGHKRPRELSGGMRQRGALARALAYDPEVLLLDEPFGSLDPSLRRKMGTLVGDLQRQTQKTFLLVTHDLDEARRLADVVWILEKKDHLQSLMPEAAFSHSFFTRR